jgi:nucleoside-diphosphate-sugar epimerase
LSNKRSLVSRDNLVDLIVTCLDHPAAMNQVFMVSDNEDLSTTELLIRMGRALGCNARLMPVPAWLLGGAAKMIGKGDIAKRLIGSLQVNIAKTSALLGWVPVISIDEGLRNAATAFLDKKDIE